MKYSLDTSPAQIVMAGPWEEWELVNTLSFDLLGE
jgi:hypothetical protein